MNIAVKIGRLTLKTPIVCASGTFGFGEELLGLADLKTIGAITTKTITLNKREGNPPPRIYETGQGVLNSVGLEGPGLAGFLRDKLPKITALPPAVIISVGGASSQEYLKIAKTLDKFSSVKALEINLSCPNLRLKKLVSQDWRRTYRLVKLLRAATRKTLIVKITPEVTDITQVARAAEEAGADALAAVNTFFGMAINVDSARFRLGSGYGGYSGPAIKPLALYKVYRAAQAVKIPVIGGGGIISAEDALEFILAGATAVSLGTVNMICPASSATILQGIKDYMNKHGVKDIRKLKGAVQWV